jgi:hypothetical protein
VFPDDGNVLAGCVLCASKKLDGAKEAFWAAINTHPNHIEVRRLSCTL